MEAQIAQYKLQGTNKMHNGSDIKNRINLTVEVLKIHHTSKATRHSKWMPMATVCGGDVRA